PSRQCCQRPPQPIPRFVTIAIRPSDRDEVRNDAVNPHFCKGEYFRKAGLTLCLGVLPVGQRNGL
ncbi:hypothetical protein, partial [Bradyrhizobium japonicum]|uniref:hypothetical protein n=1 Tax=Bradyrhizobium japonicum TaxID=375 RepID=UPI001B89DB3D